MTKPIRGKVAHILDDQELVINVGSADGVTADMQFNIMKTIQIKDPDTDQVLGEIEQSIISLRVYIVQEHISVLYSTEKSIISGDKGLFSRSLLSSSKAFVNIGDPVVQYLK